MARLFEYETGAESLYHLVQELISKGDEVSPRGKSTLEIRNATIVVNDPTNVGMEGMGRNVSMKLAVAEALQLIGGFSDPARFTKIAPNTTAFLNGGAFSGAYGPRTRPQLQTVVDRLMADPYSRQAVVTLWDPLHDMQSGIKDLPCTLAMTFTIRHDQLHMTTHMRSNDVWWGWTYDLFQFTQLQCTLAQMLSTSLGTYTHVADSLHVYTDVLDKIDLRPPADQPRTYDGIAPISSTSKRWSDVQLLAEDLFYGRPLQGGINPTDTEAYFMSVMQEVV